MKATRKSLVRFVAAVALGALATLPHAGASYAATNRPLLKADLFNYSEWMTYQTGSALPPIAGATYSRGVACEGDFACSVSFNMQRYPGYGLFTAVVGVGDAYDFFKTETNCRLQFDVNADGKILYKHIFRQGLMGTNIVVPLGKATVVTLETALLGQSCAFVIANPALLMAGAPVPPSLPTTTSSAQGLTALQLFSANVTAGGQETALISTSPHASVMLVVDYPDGTQIAVGPDQAGADGHFAYTWAVPAGIHGHVHVTVDSAGSVAQGSFAVS